MSKKYLGIICILYSAIFSYVVLFDKLKSFLAPTMQTYIKLSIIPLLIIGIVIILDKKNSYKFKLSDLILILPLVLLILAGDGRLTSSFASNRSTNFNSESRAKIIEEKEETAEEIEEINPDISKPFFEVVDENYVDLAYYFAESSKASKFIGKTIRVRGFALKEIDFMSSDYFAVGKYEISCCAADAGYLGFIVKSNYNIIQDKWYEVEGVLEVGKAEDGYDILYIKAFNVKEITSDGEEQYVYPCYSYGEEACKKTMEYNLEY